MSRISTSAPRDLLACKHRTQLLPVRTRRVAYYVYPTLSPRICNCSAAAARKCVTGTQDYPLAGCGVVVRQFSNARGFSHAVHADHQDHIGPVWRLRATIERLRRCFGIQDEIMDQCLLQCLNYCLRRFQPFLSHLLS